MKGAAILAAIAAGLAAFAQPALAAPHLGTDGETDAVYSYADAIRERVWVQVPGVDQDGDGVDDRVALEVIRPLETRTAGLKVPAIIDPSPYYTSVGRDGQWVHTSGSTADILPLFDDNYFVPRGYAVILAEANGTAWSTGCPLHGGPGDIASMKAVIDWLQGRVQGFDAAVGGSAVVADWDNGKAAMIGKSYDGTLANGVAATGVDGLTTVVPISGISSWYDYSRSNGVRFNTDYPFSLSSAITDDQGVLQLGVVPPGRSAACTQKIQDLRTQDGDETGDVTQFWKDRDYRLSVGSVHASVFISFGLNDDNVKTNQLAPWWAGLVAHNVPRKLWLSQEGHVDPFDYNRSAWVDTLHRWFDYWLYGVSNGIMLEPRVKIERSTNDFVDEADWPSPTTRDVDVFLHGTAAGSAGKLGMTSGEGATDTLTFTDSRNQSESTMVNAPDGSQTNRLTFLSPVLTHDLRISGVPAIDLTASFDKTEGFLGAILVDYSSSPFTRPSRSNDGVTDVGGASNCWDLSPAPDTGCFVEPVKPTQSVTLWRVSKGILDGENRDSLETETPMAAGTSYRFVFPMLANDYVFPAGHRVGVVVVSSYVGFPEVTSSAVPTVTVNARLSKIVLPVVGGVAAAKGAGVFFDLGTPQLQLPGAVVREATGASTVVTYTASAVDDFDADPSVSCAPASGASFALGTTTVQCQATDAAGNTSPTGSFTVTVQDTTGPALQLPAAIVREATAPSGASVTYAATADDLVDGASVVDCAPSSGSTFARGTTTVRCEATDAAHNRSTGSFAVTVVDTTAPTLHLPSGLTVDSTSSAGTPVSYAATATDAADAAPTVTCAPPSGTTFRIGTTVVACTARDADGNTATGSFVVTVVDRTDVTAPTLHAPSRVDASATSAAGAPVTFDVTASDDQDRAPYVSCVPSSGATFPIGTTTVHCLARDAFSNTRNAAFDVVVRDTTAPQLRLPGTISVDATSPRGAIVRYDAGAFDAVDAAPTLSCGPASGSVFAAGRTTVRCTARDAAGNTATGSFVVSVESAAESLRDVRRTVGKAVAGKLDQVLAAVKAGKRARACSLLRDARRAAKTKSARGELARIARVLGC
jgi:X-Pro dipeptidyl-peptidase